MDIEAAATRKLGPLPAWAWGAVVGGGVLVYRLARGGQGGAAGGTTVGVGGQGASLASPPVQLDGQDASGGDNGVPTATAGGDAIPGTLGSTFSSAFAIQNQLNDATSHYFSLRDAINTDNDKIAAENSLYTSGKISKGTRDIYVARYQTDLSSLNAQLADASKLIASLKTQLTGLFAAPATS